MFRSTRRGRIPETQAQHILKMIEDGRLKAGDRLPSERELASGLGTGRSSVREAIRYLEAMGVLETRPGLGTFVLNPTPCAVVASSVSSWLAENKEEVLKVFELREALETKASELAAARATDEMIAEIEAVLDEMGTQVETGDTERLTELDCTFHRLIGKATGNDLLYRISESIQDSLMESRYAVLSLPGRAKRSLAEHHAILDAIRCSDPEGAKRAMLVHLTNAVSEVQ